MTERGHAKILDFGLAKQATIGEGVSALPTAASGQPKGDKLKDRILRKYREGCGQVVASN